jgi:hypothetical protein
MLILASICTAYAFTASVKVMKNSYTVMLTTNLEPVYGIILAYFIIGGKEKMSFSLRWSRNYHHYSNLNGIIKHKAGKK